MIALDCDHDWEFHTIGSNITGRSPGAIYVCMRCKRRVKQPHIPGTSDPDWSAPPTYVLREGTPQLEST